MNVGPKTGSDNIFREVKPGGVNSDCPRSVSRNATLSLESVKMNSTYCLPSKALTNDFENVDLPVFFAPVTNTIGHG